MKELQRSGAALGNTMYGGRSLESVAVVAADNVAELGEEWVVGSGNAVGLVEA